MKAASLGELEKEVMEIMWQTKTPLTVRDVYVILQGKRTIAYTTVMTIMGRLTEKGLLKRLPSGKAYVYKAAYSKDKFLTKVSRQIIKNFIANFGESAVTHFAEEVERVAPKERDRLLKLLKSIKS